MGTVALPRYIAEEWEHTTLESITQSGATRGARTKRKSNGMSRPAAPNNFCAHAAAECPSRWPSTSSSKQQELLDFLRSADRSHPYTHPKPPDLIQRAQSLFGSGAAGHSRSRKR